jgi:hypothetical protein
MTDPSLTQIPTRTDTSWCGPWPRSDHGRVAGQAIAATNRTLGRGVVHL